MTAFGNLIFDNSFNFLVNSFFVSVLLLHKKTKAPALELAMSN